MEASLLALSKLGAGEPDLTGKDTESAKTSRRAKAIAQNHNKMYERPESSTAKIETGIQIMSGFHGDEIYIVHRIECGRTS